MHDNPSRPPAPMSESAKLLYEHRHAVRVGIPTDAGHAAATVANMLRSARYSSVPVPEELDAAALALARYAEHVRALVDRERAELAHTGQSAAEHQAAVETAHIRASIARGKLATGQPMRRP